MYAKTSLAHSNDVINQQVHLFVGNYKELSLFVGNHTLNASNDYLMPMGPLDEKKKIHVLSIA